MRVQAVLLLSALVALAPAGAAGQEMPERPLQVGEQAPDFEIPTTVPVPEGGSTVSPLALTARGESVVLAFFPKAFTGG